MAVYQGTRLRTTALPAKSVGRQQRASLPESVSVSPRVRPVGLLMAAIVSITVLGMVYLTPTLGTNAASTEIGRLELRHEELVTAITRNEIAALELTLAEAIVPKARKQDLKRLPPPVVLEAP